MAILPPVENLKYVPSLSLRMSDGSWALLHVPEQLRGSAKLWTTLKYIVATRNRMNGIIIISREG